NMATKSSAILEKATDRPIAYMRTVDNTNSNAMRRRVNLYIYKNSTDSDTAPLQGQSLSYYDLSVNDLHIDVGATASYLDNTGQVWITDSQYDATEHEPGYTSGYGGTAGGTTASPSITNTEVDIIYRTQRQAANTTTPLRYSIAVDPGNYF